MLQLLLVVSALVLLGGLAWFVYRQRAAAGNSRDRNKARTENLDTLMSWHPQATRVMTGPERKAYHALRAGLPDHMILAQVPLARFLKVPTRHSYSEWLRRVGVLCGDLVVCDNNSQVVAVVDIRAPEAQENERTRQRHTRMDRVLKAAEIPLHVWREDALPNAKGARAAILGAPAEALETPPPSPAIARTRTASAASIPVPVVVEEEDDSAEQHEPPSSTWFDEMDTGVTPLSPLPQRSGGPSIR